MKQNIFEMGVDFKEGWFSDNKEKDTKNGTLPCKEILSPQKHQLHFAKEKRRGKVVTIVKSFCLEKEVLQILLKTIKKKLGTGGTLKGDSLEFQGEVAEALKIELTALGYRFRK